MDTVVVEVTTVGTGVAVIAFTSYLLRQVMAELSARDDGAAPAAEPVQGRPWWRRLFGNA